MKKSKPSNNTKKLLALSLVLHGILRSDNKLENTREIDAVVSNTLQLATKFHSQADFDSIRGHVIDSMVINGKESFVDSSVAFGLVLSLYGNVKLPNFLGLHDNSISEFFDEKTTVEDIEKVLKFDDEINRRFNTKRYVSSVPVVCKSERKPEKVKRPRDKKAKKVVIKKTPKRVLVTRERVVNWCKSKGYECTFTFLTREFTIESNTAVATIGYDGSMTMSNFKKQVGGVL